MAFNPDFFKASRLDIAFFFSTLLFAAAEFFADSSFWLIENSRCFHYLGCNAGFFGYDVIVHFFGGIFEVMLIVWVGEKYLHLNILHSRFWKNALTLVMAIAFFAVVWEIYEFALDSFGTRLINSVFYILNNNPTQPGNSDTMGDMTFAILGALSGIFILRAMIPRVFKQPQFFDHPSL